MTFFKNFLLLFFFFHAVALANIYSSLEYKITPLLDSEKGAIKVEGQIKGRFSGHVVLDLPYKWGGVDYSDQIKNIQVLSPDNTFKINKKNFYRLVIQSPKTNSINFSYEIHQKSDNPSNVHHAIIRKDLIHSPGYGLFAIPTYIKKINPPLEFKISWQSLPEGWKTLSSYGPALSLKFSGTVFQLLHAVYGAGLVRTYEISKDKSPVHLSLYGNFDMKDESILSFLNEIIQTQRSFFQDWDFSDYTISIIEGDNPHSAGGTGLHNSFAAFLPKGMRQKDAYILFAHEHFHNWVGIKIQNNVQEALNYWWSEGFTEYYARVLALRSRGLSLEDFILECNQMLKEYYLSPAINAPNIRIKEDFWKDYTIQKLPYYRGFVFALYLNKLIKNHNPAYSLDNVMFDLFKSAKQNKFSFLHFETLIKSYIPQGISKEIIAFIKKGEIIRLENLMTVLPLEKAKMGDYELGFDLQSLVQEKIIKNINEKSNAYKSGLRNGDKARGWSLHADKPDQIVTLQTDTKNVGFLPENENKKDVYQVKTILTEEDKNKIKNFFDVQ